MNEAFNHNEINKIKATYLGFDVFREDYQYSLKMGNDFIDEHFYLCYHRDGLKTYYKKLDPRHFQNRRLWVISAKSGFVASLKVC